MIGNTGTKNAVKIKGKDLVPGCKYLDSVGTVWLCVRIGGSKTKYVLDVAEIDVEDYPIDGILIPVNDDDVYTKHYEDVVLSS